jgi:cystathionine beta-lyase
MTQSDTTQYDFDVIHNRRDSDSNKWNYYAADVLPMWVADMDFVSPQPVLQALHKRVEHGIFGYPQVIGDTEHLSKLRNTVIEHLARSHNWQIEPEDILLMPGVVKGFNLACHAFAEPDEAVLIQTPVYPPILHAAKSTGIQGQEMELTRQPDGSYAVDWDLFEETITEKTRLFILCNPHNPVGKVFTKTELERMAEICLRHGVLICSDEIHCDIVFREHAHTSIAALDSEVARQTITLISPSKTYNIAGLQCSLTIIQNPELRKRYQSATKGLVSWVNLMGLVAAQAAYQHGGPWLEQLLPYLEANRDFLYKSVQDQFPGISMGRPEGTYLAWLDCRQAGIEGNPYKYFLEKGRVAFNNGNTFGTGGEGFIRLNFGCPRSLLEESLKRMQQALIMK